MTFGYVLSERGKYGLKATDENGEDESAGGSLNSESGDRGSVGESVELGGWIATLEASSGETASTQASSK